MKIKQAPIADLLKYVGELYNEKPRYYKFKNIFEVINKYYCSLTNHKTIIPMGKDYLNSWCDLNWAPTMENCPNIPGILVYKNFPNGIRKFGLVYHSGFITAGKQTNFLSYYDVMPDGMVASHTYLASEWDGWGAPTRYFRFDENEYVDSNAWELGERPLTKLSIGHDVKVFQNMLNKVFPELNVTGYFDEETLEALHSIQKICNVSQSDYFNLQLFGGKKVLEFLEDK